MTLLPVESRDFTGFFTSAFFVALSGPLNRFIDMQFNMADWKDTVNTTKKKEVPDREKKVGE